MLVHHLGKLKHPNRELEVIVEPSSRFVSKKCLLVAKTVSKPDGRYIPVRVCNTMNKPVTVYRGTCLGMVSSAETVKVVNSSERVNRVNRIEVCDKVVPEHLVDLYNSTRKWALGFPYSSCQKDRWVYTNGCGLQMVELKCWRLYMKSQVI